VVEGRGITNWRYSTLAIESNPLDKTLEVLMLGLKTATGPARGLYSESNILDR
jgi:hypothetical protein